MPKNQVKIFKNSKTSEKPLSTCDQKLLSTAH